MEKGQSSFQLGFGPEEIPFLVGSKLGSMTCDGIAISLGQIANLWILLVSR